MSNYNKMIESRNGKISMYADNGYWGRRITDPAGLAEVMTATDMAKILDMCGGDFSLLDENTAKAISIKATLILEKQEEYNKKRAEANRRKAEEHHKVIIQEIRELVGDRPAFNTIDIQIAARNAGYTVRTRQMYAYHIGREAWWGDGEHTMESAVCDAEYVEVVLRNGRTSTQRVKPVKGGYRFKK